MLIIRDRTVVEDHWSHAPDVAQQWGRSLPKGDIIVPLACWQTSRSALLNRGSAIGVSLRESDDIGAIAADLLHFGLVALRFGSFTDGRAFSQARQLRERYSYRGEIRAVGRFLRDQLLFMERCGFNAFEMTDEPDLHAAMRAFSEISVRYQPGVDGPGLIGQLSR